MDSILIDPELLTVNFNDLRLCVAMAMNELIKKLMALLSACVY